MAQSPDVSGHLLTVASNVVSLAHVRRIEQTLEAANIEVVRLKGSAYLGTLYPTFDRRMVDVDLLVRPASRPRARRLLERSGYTLVPPPRLWRYSWHQHYNWQFQGDGVRPMVELHQALCAVGLFDIDSGGLVDRRVRRHDGVSHMYTLSPEDALLHLAVHLVKDGYDHDERLPADTVRLLEEWAPDWDTVVDRAGRWRVTAGLRHVLEVAGARGAHIPPAVLEALGSPARAAVTRALIDRLGPMRRRNLRFTKLAVLALEPEGARHLARFASRYALRRWIDGLCAVGQNGQNEEG